MSEKYFYWHCSDTQFVFLHLSGSATGEGSSSSDPRSHPCPPPSTCLRAGTSSTERGDQGKEIGIMGDGGRGGGGEGGGRRDIESGTGGSCVWCFLWELQGVCMSCSMSVSRHGWRCLQVCVASDRLLARLEGKVLYSQLLLNIFIAECYIQYANWFP